jgi:hypothetical protein
MTFGIMGSADNSRLTTLEDVMLSPKTLGKIEQLQEKLSSDGYGPQGPNNKLTRDVLDELLEALSKENRQE